MSDSANTPTETSNVQLNVNNVEKVLKKRRIKGMSKRKKVVWLLIILLVIAAAGFGVYKNLEKSESSGFSAAPVTKATITDSIEATGTLEPIKQSEMGFKNDETITAITVQPGDHVTKGQILAKQDPASLQSTLDQAQSLVEQDQISVQTLNITLESNRKTLDRQQKLFDAGALAQTNLDTAQNDYNRSELDVASAKSKLANDQAKLAEAQSDLSGATLVAPFDGIIGAVNGQVGQINGINSSNSTLLSIMSKDLQMSALINEADISRIKVGQDVEFTTSAFSDKTFKGKVLRITPQAETVSNIQYYPVLISCVDSGHQLLSGMSVSANIIVSQKSDVLSVPMMAISYAQSYIKTHASSAGTNKSKPSRIGTRTDAKKALTDNSPGTASAEGKRSQVVVLENDQPVIKTVVLGLSDGSKYEVVSGLNLGDKVILGSNQVSTQPTSTKSSSGNSTKQNRGGGGMGGSRMGGF